MGEPRYHISPKTNAPARCRAQLRRCSYEHFPSEEAALEFIERSALEDAGSALPAAESRAELPAPSMGELAVKYEKKSPNGSYHYQELWLRDGQGRTAAYMKINRVSWGRLDDGTMGRKPGVILCDVEISPDHRGQGYALALIRKLKADFEVETVEFTGSFSEDGYRMFQGMKDLEAKTGERLVSIRYGGELKEPPAGQTYSFVHDWEREEGRFQL